MNQGFSISDLASFEKLIAPKVLRVIYWLGLIGIGIFCLISIAGALAVMRYSFATGLGTIILSLIGGAFGVLLWRVMIELYSVFFGIFERLGDIRESLKKD